MVVSLQANKVSTNLGKIRQNLTSKKRVSQVVGMLLIESLVSIDPCPAYILFSYSCILKNVSSKAFGRCKTARTSALDVLKRAQPLPKGDWSLTRKAAGVCF